MIGAINKLDVTGLLIGIIRLLGKVAIECRVVLENGIINWIVETNVKSGRSNVQDSSKLIIPGPGENRLFLI